MTAGTPPVGDRRGGVRSAGAGNRRPVPDVDPTMPRHAAPTPRRRGAHRLVTTLATVLLFSGAAACSAGGSDDATGGAGGDQPGAPADAGSDDSIAALLALVPDTEGNRSQVIVSRYEAAATAAGLDPVDGEREEMDRISKLTNSVETGTGVAGGEITGGPRTQAQYGLLGFVPSDVRAEVSAGQPPDQVSVAVGSFDRDEVLDLAAEATDGEVVEVDGTEVARWLDDRELVPGLETPIGDLPGQAGRVALPADQVLTYANADEISTATIGTVRGDVDSLADVEELAAIATALDEHDVLTALLSTEPLETDPRMTPDTDAAADGPPGLLPYAAFGTGNRLVDGAPSLVVVLAHDDADDAATNAERLAAMVADGTSAATRQRWAELLTDPAIEQAGTVVTATFTVENPTLWQAIVFRQDSLLAIEGT